MGGKKEGANKAMYESLFSDVPVIVYRHHRGINLEHINEQTGVLYGNQDLASAILRVLEDLGQFRPREWAGRHTGCYNSTAGLCAALRQMTSRSGGRWTCDIAPKVNAPNLGYAKPSDVDHFAEAYEELEQYLRI